MPELPLGSVVGGVRIDAVTGRGGMGVVYRGTQIALKRTVALKVVRDDLASDPEFRRRFTQESEIAASLDHPNIVPIHSAGEDAGRLYVTMRFVEGTDVREAIRMQGRLAPALAAEIVAQVGGALDAAHRRGLVHRDVKPANILLGAAEGGHAHAYLTDFGLSRFTDSEQITRTGTVVGTLDYMAPEQLEGRKVDGRVDVYALGCVLYQALTGRVPYPRDTEHAKMWAHMTEPPPRPSSVAPDLPTGFDEVVARAMAKRPDDRYATAVELGAAAVAAARHATGRSWGGDPTIDIPRQQAALPTEVAPPWAGAGRSGPERAAGWSGPQRAAGWSGPQRSAAPPTTVPPAAAAVSGLAAAPTVAPPAAAPPTVQGFPGGDGHPSGPSLPPDSVPGPQWDGGQWGGGQWGAGQWGGEHGGGRWNGGQWNAHPAWPPAAQQWGAQPVAGGGSSGHAPPGPPSYPSGPLSAPRPRNNTRTVALMLTAVLVLAGVATAAVLLLRPPAGAGGGGVVADPTTAATPSRPVGTIAGAPIAVGKEPRDIEVGEGYVWTANTDGTISKVDPAAGTAEQITVGGVPAELTVAEGGVWVWNYSDAVVRVDAATGEVSDPISANGTGNITGTAVGGGFLWLSHSSSNSVSRISLATRQATGTPTTVGAAPVSMAYGNRVLYVSNTGEKTLSVLDGATGAAGNPITLEEAPAGVAVKDGTIFVGTTGDVTPIDEASYVIGDPIPLKGGSYFLADSGGIWVTFPLADELHWFDLSGQEPHGGAITGVGKGVGDMVLLDDGVWVSDTAENSVVHVQVAR